MFRTILDCALDEQGSAEKPVDRLHRVHDAEAQSSRFNAGVTILIVHLIADVAFENHIPNKGAICSDGCSSLTEIEESSDQAGNLGATSYLSIAGFGAEIRRVHNEEGSPPKPLENPLNIHSTCDPGILAAVAPTNSVSWLRTISHGRVDRQGSLRQVKRGLKHMETTLCVFDVIFPLLVLNIPRRKATLAAIEHCSITGRTAITVKPLCAALSVGLASRWRLAQYPLRHKISKLVGGHVREVPAQQPVQVRMCDSYGSKLFQVFGDVWLCHPPFEPRMPLPLLLEIIQPPPMVIWACLRGRYWDWERNWLNKPCGAHETANRNEA
mmetsp:Transcript_55224/g.118732  ORF Transcript_55224/g.118732 Transcript_55224/m.118732 type:complete len:326 (-) Transcript_55224:270-1247(-)